MLEDRFGLPLSTDVPDAVAAYVKALDLMLSANVGAAPLLEEAIGHDPEFALAHIARARMLQVSGRIPEAKEAADRAQELAPGLTERERGHIRTMAIAIGGTNAEALAAVNEHVASFPRDALPLSLTLGVYGLLAFSGRLDHHAAQLDLLEGLARHWGDDWWFLTYLGTANVEMGNCRHGAALLDRALAGNPRNGNAAHGRTHGYYEAGDVEGGRRFLTEWLPGYDRASQLHCHLSWHLAAFLLHLGDIDRVMALYDDSIRLASLPSPGIVAFADNASLIWRSALNGHPFPPSEIRDVASFALEKVPAPAPLAFFNMHIALALAAAGNEEALQRHLGQVDGQVAEGLQAAGPVISTLCKGIAAFGKDRYDRAVDYLGSAQPELDRLGGSHAQRDVVIDSLIVAMLRNGQTGEAETLMKARAENRAGHLDQVWLDRIRNS